MNERDLFLSALEIEDPAARKAHLQSACAGNGELLTRVESLLASHEGASRFLQTPVVEQLGDEPAGQTDATLVIGIGSTQDESPDGSPDASILEFSPNQEPNKMADEIPLGYLEPSTKPGSLGRLAHYEILEVVGHGAFGTVLRAFDDKLQRVVAIKVMAPELASTSPARKRFIREAQASAAIRHENVVSVYSVEEKPIPYLVMEYIPGVNLQQRLDERGPLDVATVLRMGTQIAEGLAAAHAKDLIHRDIKPGNILLETGMRDRVKITDFGLARAADDASMTQSGTIAGTPMYMAPEQALGHKLDQRADLFSFGSVLYQMVSGRPPFRASSTLAVLKRLTEDTPRPIREVIPETPVWLCDIITKLHAKNPDNRFQSAREVADLLADCEEKLKTNSKVTVINSIPERKQAFSLRWMLATAGLLIVIVGMLGLYDWLSQRPQGTPDPIKPVTTAKSSPATVPIVPVTDGWVQLFNGKDLTGWRTHPEQRGDWEVKDGVLVGSKVASYLFSDGSKFENFHLRIQAKINRGGDSGIFFRSPFAMRPGRTADSLRPAGGYEAELHRNPAYQMPRGSIWNAETAGIPKLLRKAADLSLTDVDEWFTLEIIARGNHLVTKVNGAQTAKCDDPESRFHAGSIALQVLNPQTIVQFRKIEIKELSSGPFATGNFALAFDGKESRVMIPSLRITEAHPLTAEAWIVIEDREDRHTHFDLLGNSHELQGFALGIAPGQDTSGGGEMGLLHPFEIP
jgi:serine/threonine protein kinase